MPVPVARLLIIRTTSLGDLIHTLPALSDLAAHCPGVQIDWLVEEAFAEIPAWHAAVNEAIPVAQRRWRKAWWQSRSERVALAARLRQTPYDGVLDMQGLMKSAWLARQARGVRHGLGWRSAREPLAALAYQVRHRVDFDQAAVTRQRLLAGLALGYTPQGAPDFGLQTLAATGQQQHADAPPYAAIMPSASRDDKLWPVEDWRAVLAELKAAGLACRVLAGNQMEAARAQALVAACPQACVLARLRLTEVAHTLAGARLTVGLDSGLTHLSAALGRPTVAIYRASSPLRTPLVGAGGEATYTASLGERGAPPTRAAVIQAIEAAWQHAP